MASQTQTLSPKEAERYKQLARGSWKSLYQLASGLGIKLTGLSESKLPPSTIWESVMRQVIQAESKRNIRYPFCYWKP